jgi:hypothetical protein
MNTDKPQQQITTEKLMLHLPAELVAKLRQKAKENFRTISGQVSYILQQYYGQQVSARSTKEEPR